MTLHQYMKMIPAGLLSDNGHDDNDGERPLSRPHLEQRDRNQAEIGSCLKLDEQLLRSLAAAGCITTEHLQDIALPIRTMYERNGRFLDIMRSRSVASNKNTVDILSLYGQQTAASLLDLNDGNCTESVSALCRYFLTEVQSRLFADAECVSPQSILRNLKNF